MRATRVEGITARYYRNTMPTITFKVTAAEAASIQRLARREGCSVSEFLRRRAALEPVRAPAARAYRIEASPVTGLPVIHPPTGMELISGEQIRALLSDFP